jgi:hypothetical protein
MPKREKAKRTALCVTCLWIMMMVLIVASSALAIDAYGHYKERVTQNDQLKKSAVVIWDVCKGLQLVPGQFQYINCEQASYDSLMDVHTRSRDEALHDMLNHFNPVTLICQGDMACGIHVWETVRRLLEWSGPILCILILGCIICTTTVLGPLISIARFYSIDKDARLSQEAIALVAKACQPPVTRSGDGGVFKGFDTDKLA